MDILTFKLVDTEYGVSVSKVREVLEIRPMTPIPRMPEFMKGVINIRGNVVPVIDLRIKFELEETQYNQATSIIVLEIEKESSMEVIGIIVDSVEGVTSIKKEEMIAMPEIGVNVNNDFIPGMVNLSNNFVILLNIDKIITTEEMTNLIPESKEKNPAL